MRNSSSLDWLRFMHTPNDYRVSPVSVTALLPHLRQPGTQRLSLDLCMAFGSSIDAFHAIAFLHTEKASHRAIALCIYPLKN